MTTPLSPIGWVVTDPGRHSVALFLERPMADQFAVKVHGTVDALYSGAQLALVVGGSFERRGDPLKPKPEAPHAAA